MVYWENESSIALYWENLLHELKIHSGNSWHVNNWEANDSPDRNGFSNWDLLKSKPKDTIKLGCQECDASLFGCLNEILMANSKCDSKQNIELKITNK